MLDEPAGLLLIDRSTNLWLQIWNASWGRQGAIDLFWMRDLGTSAPDDQPQPLSQTTFVPDIKSSSTWPKPTTCR
jgi:hypothetical protein